MLQEIIGLFLEDSPKLIEAIRQALSNGDVNGAYRGAHTLKGSVGNFDAHEAVALAQRLEARAREGDFEAATERVRRARTGDDGLHARLAKTRETIQCVS